MGSNFSTGILEYNGITIQFSELLEHSHMSIYDGPQYLYTRHKIHVRGVVSATSTAYFEFANPDVVANGLDNNPIGLLEPDERRKNVAEAGFIVGQAEEFRFYAPENVELIQEMLNEPRKLLRMLYTRNAEQDTVHLVSPQTDDADNVRRDCDATGGPYPEVLSVVKLYGHKTFAVEFIVYTDVADRADLYDISLDVVNGAPAAILSNTYQMSHDVDMHFLTIRTTTGKAVVDRGLMEKLNISADDLRQALLPPLPDVFRRDHVHVDISPDGTTLNYECIDRQVLLHPTGLLTKVELVQGITESTLSMQEQLNNVGIFGFNIGGVGGLLRGVQSRVKGLVEENVPEGAIKRFLNLKLGQLDAGMNQLGPGAVPFLSTGYTLNLYGVGDKGAPVKIPLELYDKASEFLTDYVGKLALAGNGVDRASVAGGFKRETQIDHAGSHLQVTITWIGGALIGSKPTPTNRGLPVFPDEKIKGFIKSMQETTREKLGGEPNDANRAAPADTRFSPNSTVGLYDHSIKPPRLKRGQAATFNYPESTQRPAGLR